MARKIHVVRISRDQPEKKFALFFGNVAVADDERPFGRHGALYVVGLSVHEADERLLNGDGALQHGLHDDVVAAVFDSADVDDFVARRDERIDVRRVVADDAFAGRLGPAAETADAVVDFQLGKIDEPKTIAWGEVERSVAQYKFHDILRKRTRAVCFFKVSPLARSPDFF